MFKVKKPIIFSWILNETWEILSLKEKDYIIFLYSRKYSRVQIMRKLYIEDRTSFWYLQKRVKEKLKTDVEKYNSYLLKIWKNDNNAILK